MRWRSLKVSFCLFHLIISYEPSSMLTHPQTHTHVNHCLYCPSTQAVIVLPFLPSYKPGEHVLWWPASWRGRRRATGHPPAAGSEPLPDTRPARLLYIPLLPSQQQQWIPALLSTAPEWIHVHQPKWSRGVPAFLPPHLFTLLLLHWFLLLLRQQRLCFIGQRLL